MEERECKVYGGLAIILPCCRAVGVAPVKLSREPPGYRATFCKRSHIYGYVLIFSLIGSSLVTELMKLIVMWKNGSYQTINLTHLPPSATLFAIVVVGSFQARSRLLNMFGYLTDLQEVTYYKGVDMKRERLTAIITTATVVTYCGMLCWGVWKEVVENNYRLITFIYYFGNIKFIMMYFMMIKVILLYTEVTRALAAISTELKDLLDTESDLERGKPRLRIVNKHYMIVCEVIVKIDKDVSLYSVLAFVFNIVAMMDRASFMAAQFIAGGQDWLFVIREGTWILLQVIRTVVFLEPFQNIEAEKTKIKRLIAKLIYHWTGCGELMSSELEQAVKQLLSVSTDVAPLGLFRYTRALLVTTFSVVITYAIVELEFKMYDIHTIEPERSHELMINSTLSL